MTQTEDLTQFDPASFEHIPVLLNECLDGLNIDPAGTYLDGTAGGAGHSRQIALRLDGAKGGRLVSLDQDPDAVQTARARLAGLPATVVYADGSYQMSILKSADGNGESVQRYFFDYPQPVAGEGHFISTYKHNGNPIPSFEGEPLRFACPRTIGDFAHGLWQNLNPDNKVSLFARVIDLETGESGDMIFNKYDAVCSDLDDPEEPELLPEELELLKKLDAEEE